MKNVTFRQLKVFETVARHLSFSRAAEELHLSQPAVSMQVKQLEEAAGLPLTEQMGKKIHLTAAGEVLARHAAVIARQLEDASESLAALRGTRGGRLTLGVVSTAKYFAPRLLAAFRGQAPEAELHLQVHNRETIIELLAGNRIDLAIMGRPPQDLPTVAQSFARHPFIFIAAPEHPRLKARRLAPAGLQGETFLIREIGSGTRATFERFLAEHKVEPGRILDMGSNETIKQAVMAGMGIAFISAHTVGLELAVKRLARLPVAGTPVMRDWFVVHRAEKRLLPLAEAFRAFLIGRGEALIDMA